MAKKSNKEILLDLLRTLSRPGTDAVVEYISKSNFALKHGGESHHKYRGGLVDHSLEVYRNMKEKAAGLNIPEESIIICSIFHDLGKLKGQHDHPAYSVEILEQCGFELKDEERLAISTHHTIKGAGDLESLQSLLKRSDMLSTGEWQEAHPKPNTSIWSEIKKDLLTFYSKL